MILDIFQNAKYVDVHDMFSTIDCTHNDLNLVANAMVGPVGIMKSDGHDRLEGAKSQ